MGQMTNESTRDCRRRWDSEKSEKQRVKYINVPLLLFKGKTTSFAELPKSFNMHAEPCDEEV